MIVESMQHNRTRKSFLVLMAVTLTAFLFVLSGCITEKKRLEICKTCALKTERKDSIIVEYKEKRIPYLIKDSIPYWLPNPCADLCDSLGNLKSTFKKEIKSDKGTKLQVYVKDNNLVFKDVLDSLKGVITVQEKTIKQFSSIKEQVPARCELKHFSWWDKVFVVLGKIFFILLFIALIFLVIKFYVK